MACIDNSAPLNLSDIDKKTIQKCDVTCNYQFSYGASSCKVTPNGNFLSYKYDGMTVVNYNQIDAISRYNVEEIRIYSPPLTKYTTTNDNDAVAELFIHHTSVTTGKNLLICIPIAENNSSSKSSELLEQIISPSIDKTGDEQSINVQNFTLDNLIPISEYFQYNGNIPYSPSGNNICPTINADIIIFPANGFINMTTDTKNLLQTIITSSNVPGTQSPSSVGIRYNKNGTIDNKSSGDDIYIECNPVGDDGEVIEPNGNTDTTNTLSDTKMSKPKMSPETKQKLIKYLTIFAFVILGFALLFGIGYGIYYLLNNIGSSNSSVQSSSSNIS